jgi:hypothetical protein
VSARRQRFRVDPRLKWRRQFAIERAYNSLVCWAVELTDPHGSPRPVIARDLAEKARVLIAEFGVRA